MSYKMLNVRDRKYNDNGYTLEKAALSFIRNNCENLRFENNAKPDVNTGKDIDRLCLENAIARFLESGRKEDAFDVYFCYLEMFVGDYSKTRRMIELLSEFEATGGGLLMKHRDHYSHSVYVFSLGLAIFESNSKYRSCYMNFYKIDDEQKAAHHFLKHWGIASLFHDIGYPFELPFEQVASYFEVDGDSRNSRPFVAYNKIEGFTELDEFMQKTISEIYNTNRVIKSTDELFAYVLSKELSEVYKFSEDEMFGVLRNKPIHPDRFGHFMDHAYFSATVLFKKLFCELKCELTKELIDSVIAILLHNSLYKFNVAYYKDESRNIPFRMELQPLAFMLMLCDELQCWDRTAYGRNSRRELHPMSCKFDFSNESIKATYIFDKNEKMKMDSFEAEYETWQNDKNGKKPKLKAYSNMYVPENEKATTKSDFVKDIESIVDMSDIKLMVEIEKSLRESANVYLSDSNYIHLYDFAIILNGRYEKYEKWEEAVQNNTEEIFLASNNMEELEKSFAKLPLEFKLSNINQAKAFAKYLQKMDCFYTDRTVDFDMVESFSREELVQMGIMEHQRWLNEHYDMGWIYSEKEKSYIKRLHWSLIAGFDGTEVDEELARDHFLNHLSEDFQNKDIEPMQCIVAMLKCFDGIRVYRIKKGDK